MVKRSSPYLTSENYDEKTTEWLELVRSTVYSRPHLQLKPKQCALIVVDMLNYFCTPSGRAYLPAAEAIISGIVEMLKVWRSFGGSVIYTRHCHDNNDGLGMLGRFFSDYIRCGERESEIVDSLAPDRGDIVLKKNTYDGFHGTGLGALLEERNISQVCITGVLTQMCCETTARSAFVRGFEVYFTVNGTATSSEFYHTASLINLASGFAVMMSVEEVLQKCATTA